MSCHPHLVRRNGAPTQAPPATGIHWVDETTGREYFSVGTSTVDDWLPRDFLIKHKVYCNQLTDQSGIDVTGVVLELSNQSYNSNNTIMNCETVGEVEININGTFEFELCVTADTDDGARRTSVTRLQRDTGTGFVDVPLIESSTVAYGYHRNNVSGENTATSRSVITVNSGDKFRYIIRNKDTVGIIKTVANGTSLTVTQL